MSNEVEYKRNVGRPPSDTPKDRWVCSVDLDVAIFWRAALWDTLTNQVRKGAMSELTTRLLREEMNRVRDRQQATPGLNEPLADSPSGE